MKALVWEAPRTMRLRECADPVAGPGEVLVRVAAVGICGSELEGYLGNNSLRQPPLVMGHEFCGEVVARGPGISAHTEGDRVVVNPLYGCGDCAACRRGDNHLCPDRILMGAHRPGAFAEVVAVPAREAYPLAAGVPAQLGALCEPSAVCLHALRRAQLAPLERVAIWGAGALGAIAAQVALAVGAGEVTVIDTNASRLAAVQALGVHRTLNAADLDPDAPWATLGERPDLALDCVGRSVTRRAAAQALRRGGRLVLLGLHDPETALAWNDLIRREISVLCSFAYAEQDFARAVHFVAAGGLKTGAWLQTDALESGPDWFVRMSAGTVGISKVVLTP